MVVEIFLYITKNKCCKFIPNLIITYICRYLNTLSVIDANGVIYTEKMILYDKKEEKYIIL